MLLLLLSHFSRVRRCDPRDGSPPGSPSLGFSRQEYWSRVPLPSLTLTLASSISHCPFKSACAALIRPCFLLQAPPRQLGPHLLPGSPVYGGDSGVPPGGHKVSCLHASSGRSSPASTASLWSSASALCPQWLQVGGSVPMSQSPLPGIGRVHL